MKKTTALAEQPFAGSEAKSPEAGLLKKLAEGVKSRFSKQTPKPELIMEPRKIGGLAELLKLVPEKFEGVSGIEITLYGKNTPPIRAYFDENHRTGETALTFGRSEDPGIMVPICETIAPVIAHTPEGQKETGRMKLFTHYELKPKGPDSGSLEIDIAEKKFVLDMVGKFIGNAFAYGLDSLTGLLSGKVFESMFNEKVSEAAAKNGNISLIISKIDPLANTARSKKAVEYVISETADILRNTLKSGSVFRVNEDIFAIVLEDSVGKAAKAAEQLRVAIESHAFNYVVETSPFESFPMPIKVTCSFGVSGFDILGKDSKAEKMVLSADAYLEIARKLGRNQVFPCPDGE